MTVVLVFRVLDCDEPKNPVPCSEMARGNADLAHRLAAPFVSDTDRYRYGLPDLTMKEK